MNHSANVTGKSGIHQERRYIRIDNKICFLDDDYYEKVFCHSHGCWLRRIVFIAVLIGVVLIIGLVFTGNG